MQRTMTRTWLATITGAALLVTGTSFAGGGQDTSSHQKGESTKQEKQRNSQSQAQQGKQSQAKRDQQSQPQQIQGKVTQSKAAKVRGNAQSNQILLLETQQGEHIAVDLGPQADLKDVQLKQGTPLTVRGTVVNIEGKPFFMAQQFRMGNTQRDVRRPEAEKQLVSGRDSEARPNKQFQGQIENIREVKVKGAAAPHRVGTFRTQGDRRLYADFGPTTELKNANLQSGDQVKLQGYGVKQDGRAVLVVEQLTKDGKTIDIQRKRVADVDKRTPQGQQGQTTGQKQNEQQKQKQKQQQNE